MKVSELIAQLEAFKAEHGDLPVALKETESSDGWDIDVHEPLVEAYLAKETLDFQRRKSWPNERWDSVYPSGDYLVVNAT